MSEEIKETLTQVLDDVIKNRAQLANQVMQQGQQIEVGKAQLVKFDGLIAALQHSVSSEVHLAEIAIKAEALKLMGDETPPAAANG